MNPKQVAAVLMILGWLFLALAFLTSCVSVPMPPFGDRIGEAGTLHLRTSIRFEPRLTEGEAANRDLWNALGTGDMLERALIIALKQGFRSDPDIETALSLCTDAEALGLPAHRLVVGASADLVALDAETPGEAVALRPVRKLVMKGGVVLAREGRYIAS